MDRDRFLELVAACLADEADADAQRAVLAAAGASSELGALLVEQVRLDAALRAHHRDPDAFVGRFRQRITAKGRSAAFSAAVRERFERERTRTRWWVRRLWPLVVALGVVLAIVLVPLRRAAPPVAAAVVVAAGSGSEIIAADRRAPAVVGAALAVGDSCRAGDGGVLVVRLADGETVAARGAASWTLRAGGVRLDAGAIDVAKPPAAPTLAIATPAWDVAILASRCALATGADGDRVEPDDGEARVVRRTDGAVAQAGAGDAVVAADDGRPERRPRRVAEGLLGLWLFDAGRGDTVPAVVGGSRLDLAIDDPGHAAWLPHGLRVDPIAGLASVGGMDLRALAGPRAVTFECWAVTDAGDQDGLILVGFGQSPIPSMGFTAHSLVPGRLCHLVIEAVVEDGRCIVYAWRDGVAVDDPADVGEAVLLEREFDAQPRVRIATATDPAAASAHVELRLVAIYAGALGVDAIRRNHAAGLPQSAALLAPSSHAP